AELTATRGFGAYFSPNPPIQAPRPNYGLLHSTAVFGIALPSPASHRWPLGCGCSSVVEHDLAKVGVEGSSPFARSRFSPILPRSVDASATFTGIRLALACVAMIAATGAALPAEQSITLATTPSVAATGLLANILPSFTAKTGIAVKIVAQPTGRALDTARRGDADVVLVSD